MTKPTLSLEESIQQADVLASRYLGNANEAYEKGDQAKGDKLYAKAQFWLDRLNKLTGNS